MNQHASSKPAYYVPHGSWWPFSVSVFLGFLVYGLGHLLHEQITIGLGLTAFAVMGLLVVVFLWFRDVIHESLQGFYSDRVHESFQIGMLWFIFTECCFFISLLASLVYVRCVVVPMLGGVWESHLVTKEYLYPHFEAHWPLLVNPDPALVVGPNSAVEPWGIPLLNTLILLLSAATLTQSHHSLLKNRHHIAAWWSAATVILGFLFLHYQWVEYAHAYHELKLSLGSGIYASLFYFITGFHGLHVFLGSIFLMVITGRLMYGHFHAKEHFAFNAAAWYWHFVDIVWWFVFAFVYCL